MKFNVGFAVLRAVLMKIPVFWDITPHNPLKDNRRSACYLLHASFLIDLFFDPEDGGDMYLRNIG
jgi:hypothetical protein